MGGATLLKSKWTTTDEGRDSMPSCDAKQLVWTPIIKGTGADKYSNNCVGNNGTYTCCQHSGNNKAIKASPHLLSVSKCSECSKILCSSNTAETTKIKFSADKQSNRHRKHESSTSGNPAGGPTLQEYRKCRKPMPNGYDIP